MKADIKGKVLTFNECHICSATIVQIQSIDNGTVDIHTKNKKFIAATKNGRGTEIAFTATFDRKMTNTSGREINYYKRPYAINRI